MKQTTVDETEFFEFHNRIMDEGCRIIRCIEISGHQSLKQYFIVWM